MRDTSRWMSLLALAGTLGLAGCDVPLLSGHNSDEEAFGGASDGAATSVRNGGAITGNKGRIAAPAPRATGAPTSIPATSAPAAAPAATTPAAPAPVPATATPATRPADTTKRP